MTNAPAQLPLFQIATTNTAPTAAGSGVRDPRDFYPTPVGLVSATLNLISGAPNFVLDPCAGQGVWGEVARRKWNAAHIAGVDLFFPDHHPAYNVWEHTDFLHCPTQPVFDLVMMNPPYGKKAMAFIQHARRCLKPSGQLIALVLIGLLAAQSRLDFWTIDYSPEEVYILPRRPNFRGKGGGSGTDKYNYMVVLWGSESNPHDPALRWLEWNYSSEDK